MNKCPITYDTCENRKYSIRGLNLLSKRLKNIRDFPLTAREQIECAMELATKLSVQGVQPKLSLKLNPEKELFEIVESGGTYILKPPHQIYAELPQNEDLTMKMASAIG
ncbi:MAG: type II toxin-antitoxin system HipA family toxin, partial [Parachlamydiaceae bacterium]